MRDTIGPEVFGVAPIGRDGGVLPGGHVEPARAAQRDRPRRDPRAAPRSRQRGQVADLPVTHAGASGGFVGTRLDVRA